MPNATVGYGRFSYLSAFFGIFSYITTCYKRYNFIKLLRIVCLGKCIGPKDKPL